MKIVWGVGAIVYGLFLLGLYKRMMLAGAAAAEPVMKRIPGGVGLLLGVLVALMVYLALGVLVLAVGGLIASQLFASH